MTELRAGIPVVTDELTIVPIEAIYRDRYIWNNGFYASGFKQPVAVVILRRFEKKAFDVTGNDMDVLQLAKEVPGLMQILDDFAAAP